MRPVVVLVLFSCLSLSVKGQYNFYFGNLHAHSSYSDGNKDSTASGFYTPGDDYNYAKASYHMDFLGIADHNHYNASNNPGMHVADYAKGVYQADTANRDGSFVCLYGFEWGVISNGGHVITYGVPGLVGWESGSGAWGPANNYDIFCAKSDYMAFWSVIKNYPRAFCTLAHPQSGDYNDLADAAPYSTLADSAIEGIAIRSGNAMSVTTDYSDPAPTLYQSVYFKTLAKGYKLGPVADQDNHYTTFGRTNKTRTVVLSTELSRDSIMAAYKARRFYASDDWNAKVTFTVNGSFMGSDITTFSDASIFVMTDDADGAADPVSKIELYYGSYGSGINPVILTSNTGSTSLSYTHPLAAGSRYYYFAKITQQDGDILWTSPVWVYRPLVLPIDITDFAGKRVSHTVILNWRSLVNSAAYFEVERSSDGLKYERIGTVMSSVASAGNYDFTDLLPEDGINLYRLRIVAKDGSASYSPVVAIPFDRPLVRILSVYPNPAGPVLHMLYEAGTNRNVTCVIYNSEGRQVKSFSSMLNTGVNIIRTDISSLAAGTYFVVLSEPGKRIAETRFIKQ